MKKLIGLVLLGVIAATAQTHRFGNSTAFLAEVNQPTNGGGGGQTASDDFDTYTHNAALDAQGSWAVVSGASGDQMWVEKPASDGEIWSNNSGVEESCNRWTAGTWSANQYSVGVLSAKISGIADMGVSVRCQSGSATYYAWYMDPNDNWYLIRMNSGSGATVSSGTCVWIVGSTIRLEVTGTGSGTRLTGKHDVGGGYTNVFTSVDPGGTYIDGGNPGVAGWGDDVGTRLDDWSAGDL